MSVGLLVWTESSATTRRTDINSCEQRCAPEAVKSRRNASDGPNDNIYSHEELEMSTKEHKETHPSYGMVGISSVSIGGRSKMRLFGSSLDRHYSTIRLRICAAERHHSLGYDHFYAGECVAEVEMSAAQFAEFVTTPNVGSGVPCTIRYLNGTQVEDPPDGPKVEAEMVREGFDENVKKVASRLDTLTKMVAKMEKASPTAAERKAIVEEVRMARQEIASNLPFMLHQFEEATTRITTAAKAEVEAFVTHAVLSTGLDTLKQLHGDNTRKKLGA